MRALSCLLLAAFVACSLAVPSPRVARKPQSSPVQKQVAPPAKPQAAPVQKQVAPPAPVKTNLPAVQSTIKQCRAQDLECPEFTIIRQEKGYEVRRYEPSMWVSHTQSALDYDAARTSFNMLFQYLSGENDQRKTIDMTAPVLTRVEPAAGPGQPSDYTMSFYVPKELWNNVPKPTGRGVFLERLPELTVFVADFAGFARGNDFSAAGADLVDAIGDSSLYRQDYAYTAGYDSPFKFWDRRNEVWLVAV